jgi:hypothetical protein
MAASDTLSTGALILPLAYITGNKARAAGAKAANLAFMHCEMAMSVYGQRPILLPYSKIWKYFQASEKFKAWIG